MHRSSVDLPDPDGPRIAMTSPRWTSRSMPRSTLSRPNRLCTPWTSTMGRSPDSVISGRGPDTNRQEIAAYPLQRRERQLSRCAAGEAALEIVLADGRNAGEDEVPDAGIQEQLSDEQVG